VTVETLLLSLKCFVHRAVNGKKLCWFLLMLAQCRKLRFKYSPLCAMLTSQRQIITESKSVVKRWLSYTLKLVMVLNFKLLFIFNMFLAFFHQLVYIKL